MLFALLQGTRTDRRNALGGVMLAIGVLLCFIAFNQLFLAFGAHNRLPPFVAVIATEVIFGAIGLHLLALSNGWWWQLLEVGKRWQAQWSEDRPTDRDDTQ
jgi:lipopolysaccharide export LptBFGC system permease protein LptF